MAIAARAIIRAGTGNKYWSAFGQEQQGRIEKFASDIYGLLFRADSQDPVRSLDVPPGGSPSASDAVSLLIDFLIIADMVSAKSTLDASQKALGESYVDDGNGEATIKILRKALKLTTRFTGNTPASLGLHPAAYFYNDRGRHSRFLFLGMSLLLSEKLKNNDSDFFQKFTSVRGLEELLVEQKPVMMAVLSSTNKHARIQRVRDLLEELVSSLLEQNANSEPIARSDAFSLEKVLTKIGVQGKILDVSMMKTRQNFDEDAKRTIIFQQSWKSTAKCPICNGYLLPSQSVSFDHKIRVRDGGIGSAENGQMAHPFCNTGVKC